MLKRAVTSSGCVFFRGVAIIIVPIDDHGEWRLSSVRRDDAVPRHSPAPADVSSRRCVADDHRTAGSADANKRSASTIKTDSHQDARKFLMDRSEFAVN